MSDGEPINNFLRVSDIENGKSYILDLTRAEIRYALTEIEFGSEPIDVATKKVVEKLLETKREKIIDDGRDCFAELML